jgi:translation elongation factor EF-4
MTKTRAQRLHGRIVRSRAHWTEAIRVARTKGEPDEQLTIAMQWLLAALKQIADAQPGDALEYYTDATDQIAGYAEQIQSVSST